MTDKDKIRMLEEILYDFDNMYTWEFRHRLKVSIKKLKEQTEFNTIEIGAQLIEMGRKDALQVIDNWLKSYPEDIFPKITPSLLKKASDFFMTNFGFPLDRLSAHILRDALIKIKGEIENGKNKTI